MDSLVCSTLRFEGFDVIIPLKIVKSNKLESLLTENKTKAIIQEHIQIHSTMVEYNKKEDIT